MKKLFIITVLVAFTLSSYAQYNSTFRKNYEIADAYIYDGNFLDALPILKQLDSIAPNNSNIQFLIGTCYLQTVSDKNMAIQYLEKASNDVSTNYYGKFNETTAPVFSFYHLGKAYHFQNKFDLAIENYEKFKYYLTTEDKELTKEVDRQIEMAYNGKKLCANPITIFSKNLGTLINSPYPDYAPVISPDMKQIIYTSRREGSTGGKKDEQGKYFEDIYIADFDRDNFVFSNAKQIPGDINTAGHEASISMSWDGQELFIYKDDKGDGNIYKSKIVDGTWSKAEKLAKEINSSAIENHITVSPDGEKLYFVSDRKGGFGGKDIWVCKKIGNDKWSPAENLGSRINTEYDEEAPVLLSDGKTMYFSSRGHESMGGFDIFYSIYENDEWSFPQSLGFPLNTTDDDVFFVPTLDGKEAYYSTISTDGEGDLDIYKITITGEIEQLAVLTGSITDTINNTPLNAKINIFEMGNDEPLSQITTDKDGEYIITLSHGKKYKIDGITETGYTFTDYIDVPFIDKKTYSFYKPYYFGQTILSEVPDTIINKINVGERMGDRFVLRNVYFDFDKSTLRPESKDELNRLLALLKSMPEIKIELLGHTDNKGSASYNQSLSDRRAKAVVDYLIANGTDEKRLSSKGYGLSQPIASNETDAGRQLNRRVEFRIVGSFANAEKNADNKFEISKAIDTKYSDVIVNYEPKWYIIGGSFTFLKNAEKHLDELIKDGYKNASIVGQNSTGSFRVAYDSFKTKDDALKAINKIKNETKQNFLWILQK